MNSHIRRGQFEGLLLSRNGCEINVGTLWDWSPTSIHNGCEDNVPLTLCYLPTTECSDLDTIKNRS